MSDLDVLLDLVAFLLARLMTIDPGALALATLGAGLLLWCVGRRLRWTAAALFPLTRGLKRRGGLPEMILATPALAVDLALFLPGLLAGIRVARPAEARFAVTGPNLLTASDASLAAKFFAPRDEVREASLDTLLTELAAQRCAVEEMQKGMLKRIHDESLRLNRGEESGSKMWQEATKLNNQIVEIYRRIYRLFRPGEVEPWRAEAAKVAAAGAAGVTEPWTAEAAKIAAAATDAARVDEAAEDPKAAATAEMVARALDSWCEEAGRKTEATS